MDFGMSFFPISVSLVCGGAWFTRLGEDHFLNPNSKIWYQLFSLSQPWCWVLVQNCLDFHEISFFGQIWLKIQCPPFSKWFLRFFHHIDWMLTNIYKFRYPLYGFSQLRSWVLAQNCLDFHEISFFWQIWLKIQSPPFSKWFMGFVHHIEGMSIIL